MSRPAGPDARPGHAHAKSTQKSAQRPRNAETAALGAAPRDTETVALGAADVVLPWESVF